MLAPTTKWEEVFGRGGFKPSYLVTIDVGGGTTFKFLKATYPRYGYINNVHKVTRRPSSLNTVTGEQTVAALTLEFIADDTILDVIFNHYLEGKDVSVKIGANLDSDTDFLETDFDHYTTGIINKHRRKGGIVIIDCHDPRSVMWDRPGMTQTVPSTGYVSGDVGQLPLYRGEGCATVGVKELLSVGMAGAKINAASFTAANNPKSGHLVIDRRRVPDPNNYTHLVGSQKPDDYGEGEPWTDRRIREPQPAQQLVEQVLKVLRSTLLVHEDGVAKLKELDSAEASVFTFTADDIVKGSFENWLDHKSIVTSAEVYTAFEGLESAGGPVHRMRFRSDDAGALASWAYSDGTNRKADWTLQDDFFSSIIIRDPYASNLAAGATTITDLVKENENFTGQGRNTPLAVDATHPMYLYVWGMQAAVGAADYADANGEIIKVTKVITNADGSFTFGDGGSPNVRGQFGTTDRQHGRQGVATNGFVSETSDVYICDITAVVRAVQEVVGQYKNGVDMCSFKTPLAIPYKVQLGDVVIVECDDFISKAQRGLPVGNTITWRCVEKDADGETMEVAWTFERLYPASSHTLAPGNNHWGRGSGGGWGLNPGGASGGWRDFLPFEGALNVGTGLPRTGGELVPAFLQGATPQNATGLQVKIPSQVIGTRYGIMKRSESLWTLTASRDTYFDFRPLPGGLSEWQPTPVANGAGAPAIPTGHMRAFKVVTNATDVVGPNVDLRNKASHDIGINVRDGLNADDYKRVKNVATLPAASTAGQLMVERGTDMAFRDDGSAWIPLRGSGAQEQVQAVAIDAMFETFTLASDRNRRMNYANTLLPFFDRGKAVDTGANPTVGLYRFMAGGTINAAFLSGGWDFAKNCDDMYMYDGYGWRDDLVNMPAARYAGASAGIFNAGFVACGIVAGAAVLTCIKLDGYTWAASTSQTGNPRYNISGCGRHNSFMAVGGYDGASITRTDQFNGGTWQAKAALVGSRYDGGAAGNVNAIIFTCGYYTPTAVYFASTQFYNGYEWYLGPDSSNIRGGHTCVGTAGRCGIDSGQNAAANVYHRERYNGSEWSNADATSVLYHHIYSNQGVGTASASITTHGSDDIAATTAVLKTEKYLVENPVDLVVFGIADDELLDFTMRNAAQFAFAKKFDGILELIPAPRSGFNEVEQAAIALINRHNDPGDGAWSATGGNMASERARYAACGVKAAGIAIGGRDNTGPTWFATTEEFNGSTYSAGGSLTGARNYHQAFGRQNAAVACFGTPTDTIASATAWAQTYDGTTWTNVSSPGGTARVAGGGAGVRNAGFVLGGLNTASAQISSTEEWNGATFSAGTAFISVIQESHLVGHLNAALCAGGYSGGSEQRTTFSYNGSAYIFLNYMLRPSYGGARFGSSSYCMVAGGTVDPVAGGAGAASTFCTRWNGYVWSIAPSLSSARAANHAGFGSGRHGVAAGGEVAGASVATSEEYKTNLVFPTALTGLTVARLFYDW